MTTLTHRIREGEARLNRLAALGVDAWIAGASHAAEEYEAMYAALARDLAALRSEVSV